MSPACADPLCISESIRGLSGRGGTCGKSCQFCYFLGFPEKAGEVNLKVQLCGCVEREGTGVVGSRDVPCSVPVAWLKDLPSSQAESRGVVPWAGKMLERDLGILNLFFLLQDVSIP